MLRYDSDVANQFLDDVRAIGLEPFHYRGREHWEGPAVAVDDPTKVTQVTRVRVHEERRRQYVIVHPRLSAGKPIET